LFTYFVQGEHDAKLPQFFTFNLLNENLIV